jgi:hypothetical protein
MKTDIKKANWHPLPDPVRENEVSLSLQWAADSRTARAPLQPI